MTTNSCTSYQGDIYFFWGHSTPNSLNDLIRYRVENNEFKIMEIDTDKKLPNISHSCLVCY